MFQLPEFRKKTYQLAMSLNRSALRELNFMREKQWLAPEKLQGLQEERLEQMLDYAYRHVPYYRKVFDESGLGAEGIRSKNFRNLPILDKPEIRANYASLISQEAQKLSSFKNRTGGSTGEPLEILQSREAVRIVGGAVLQLFYEWHGIAPGDKEIKLWGSERDLFYPARWTLAALRQELSGVKLLNAFRMSPERMREYLAILNAYQPKLLRGYVSNLYELAIFAETEGIAIRAPQVIIASAGTLHQALRDKMQAVYGTKVYNHYGSRELHNMVMECPEGNLHVSAFTHVIEVLDADNRPCPSHVEGDLVISSLVEAAMPVLRYRIGDRGSFSDKACSCGRGLPVLASLSGRQVSSFRTKDGRIIPGEYFIHCLGVYMAIQNLARFQVIQEDYDRVRYLLKMQNGLKLDEETKAEIVQKTCLVMGDNCEVSFEYMEEIEALQSGKYVYTVSKVN